MKLPLRRLLLSIGAISMILLQGTGHAIRARAVERGGIDRKSEDVMRNLRSILGCRPYKGAKNTCIARKSGLQNVFVNSRRGTHDVTSVETLVRTGGENVRDVRRATPSVMRLVSFLMPDGNRAAKSALSAIARTKKTECVQLLRYAHYEMEVERVVPADVEGVFANLIIRKLPSETSQGAAGAGRRPRWTIIEKCQAG